MKTDLENAIRTGQFQPGQAVPSESELIGRYRVSSTTARRCLDELAAEGLLERMRGKGTFVSDLAGVLKRQRVAVVIKDFLSMAHPFLATMVGTIEQTLEAAQAHVVIVRAQVSNRETNLRLLDLIEHEEIKHALILSNIAQQEILPIVEAGVRCLGVNIRYLDPRIPFISLDAEALFCRGLEELARRGHREIAIFIEQPAMHNEGLRNSTSLLQSGYAAVRERHPELPRLPRLFHIGAEASLARQVQAALAQKPSPTAFLCWDELSALEVMRAVQEAGLKVPQDISIVGTRLLPTSPVACVNAPLADIARTAAHAMLSWMQGETPESQLIPPTDFLPRETIAEAPTHPLS